jgi:hypothetical protein
LSWTTGSAFRLRIRSSTSGKNKWLWQSMRPLVSRPAGARSAAVRGTAAKADPEAPRKVRRVRR